MRVLQWIVERCDGRAHAAETPLGLHARLSAISTGRGIDFGPEKFAQVTGVDAKQWHRELASHDDLFDRLGPKQPAALNAEREHLRDRLG